VLGCFHFLVFLAVLPRNTGASIFHDGCWMFKFLVVFGCVFASMWIPNTFFQGYMYFAMYISIGFLIYQALLMLIVSYKLNDSLVGNYNRTNAPGIAAIIIIMTSLLTGLNVTWIVYQYIWFSGCGYNTSFITITTVLGGAFYGLIFLRTRSDASILTSSFVLLYCLYLQWSAMASNVSGSECNPFYGSNANTGC
jgi:hypothetical protein